jgi:hypothetical protein
MISATTTSAKKYPSRSNRPTTYVSAAVERPRRTTLLLRVIGQPGLPKHGEGPAAGTELDRQRGEREDEQSRGIDQGQEDEGRHAEPEAPIRQNEKHGANPASGSAIERRTREARSPSVS